MNIERPTPIVATVDYERDGVQHGFLRLPYSHDESAWGSVRIVGAIEGTPDFMGLLPLDDPKPGDPGSRPGALEVDGPEASGVIDEPHSVQNRAVGVTSFPH